MPANDPDYKDKITFMDAPCTSCGNPLPPGTAGKCAKCRGSESGVGSVPVAPHCPLCKAPLQYSPRSPMAVYNNHECPEE